MLLWAILFFFCPDAQLRYTAQSIYFKQHWKDIVKIIIFGIEEEKKNLNIDSEHECL